MDFLQSYTFTVVDFLSGLTVLAQVFTAVLLAFLLKDVFTRSNGKVCQWISRHGLLLMFIVALTATCGSLFFSEIAGWTPCKDCWLQRIVMYPQVVLLGIALWKRDTKIAPYILALCLIGIVLSTSHYIEQVQAALQPVPKENGVNALLKPCDSSGISCASTQIHFTFGYITIPMMALTAFALNGLGSFVMMRTAKRTT